MSRTFQQHKSSDEPVPGYRLVRFLGKGNFGEVWMASAPGNKKVALKIIDLRGLEGLQESKAIERIKDINHAHLVSIFAYWLIDRDGRILDDKTISQLSLGNSAVKESAAAPGGTMYVAAAEPMRPVELIVAMSLGAKNLSDLLQEYRQQNQTGIPVEALLEYMEDAAKGLDYLNAPLHDLGKGPLSIIHGDIKPQNLLIVGNSLQICDFGLARGIEELRKTATAMGSFAYAAPELLDGHPHVRSDQYCLAVTYVELRTGDLPLFGETNILKIAAMHRDGKLDLSGLGPGEAEVIRKATHPDPRQRWQSCREMVRELRAAVERDSAGKQQPAVGQSAATTTRGKADSITARAQKLPAPGRRRFPVGPAALLVIMALGAAAAWWGRDLLKPRKVNSPEQVAEQEPPQPPASNPEPGHPRIGSTKAPTEQLPVVKPEQAVAKPAEPAKPVVDHAEKPAVLEHAKKPPDAEVLITEARTNVEQSVKAVRSARESHGPAGLLANPFGDDAEAQRCYALLRASRRGLEAIPHAERTLAAGVARELRFDLAAAAIFKTTPDLATAQEISTDWIDGPEQGGAIDPADAELAWHIAVRARLPQSTEAAAGPDDRGLVKASTRLIHVLAEHIQRDRKQLNAEAAKTICTNFLRPVLERTAALVSGRPQAEPRNELGDFYVSAYDLITNNRGGAWPVPDQQVWTDALLDTAIDLKAGPTVKSGEPWTPVSDVVLQRLYRERAERGLARDDCDLDRAVADAGRASASDLLADALGRRALLRETREPLVEDLDAAVDKGKKANTAYGLASLAVAYVRRANYDNHPAYSREARELDLSAAAASLIRAEQMAPQNRAASPGGAQDPDGYLYHLTAARAYEDLAWLVEKDPAANINRAIREFAKAAEISPLAPQPLCGMGRCYYQALAEMFLPPDALQKPGGERLGNEVQVMDECERAMRGALAKDPGAAEAAEYLARLDQYRAVGDVGRHQNDADDKEALVQAKQCSAKADEQARAARDLARKQGLRNWEHYAAAWAMFPLSDIRYDLDEEQGLLRRRRESLSRLEALEDAPKPGGAQKLRRAVAFIRGRLAELDGKYNAAFDIYSAALPQDLAASQGEDAGLLLTRAACRLKMATKEKPPAAGGGASSKLKNEEAQRAAADAAAAGRVAFFLKERISALEQVLFAHALLYFAATTPAERAAMYARGLDDVTNLDKLAPRRPQEYRCWAAWARVAWGQVEHCPPDRNERLKCLSSAVQWASRAVESCKPKQARAQLIESLLKPYASAALKFADEQLSRIPQPNPPFRTDLEKKRQEWKQIVAGLP